MRFKSRMCSWYEQLHSKFVEESRTFCSTILWRWMLTHAGPIWQSQPSHCQHLKPLLMYLLSKKKIKSLENRGGPTLGAVCFEFFTLARTFTKSREGVTVPPSCVQSRMMQRQRSNLFDGCTRRGYLSVHSPQPGLGWKERGESKS